MNSGKIIPYKLKITFSLCTKSKISILNFFYNSDHNDFTDAKNVMIMQNTKKNDTSINVKCFLYKSCTI